MLLQVEPAQRPREDRLTINGQYVVFGSRDGTYGIHRSGNGIPRLVGFSGTWDPLAPPDDGVTSAPVLDSKGNVLIAGPDHLLYRIDEQSKLLGTSKLPGRPWGNLQPLADAKGNAYFRIPEPERIVSVTAAGKPWANSNSAS